MTGAALSALSQGQVFIAWQAPHFRKLRQHSQAQISWQAQHYGKVRYGFRGRRREMHAER